MPPSNFPIWKHVISWAWNTRGSIHFPLKGCFRESSAELPSRWAFKSRCLIMSGPGAEQLVGAERVLQEARGGVPRPGAAPGGPAAQRSPVVVLPGARADAHCHALPSRRLLVAEDHLGLLPGAALPRQRLRDVGVVPQEAQLALHLPQPCHLTIVRSAPPPLRMPFPHLASLLLLLEPAGAPPPRLVLPPPPRRLLRRHLFAQPPAARVLAGRDVAPGLA
mmetsp:Transcript_16695/g.29475  ORF Transcript_16695/g.29475 Transcript_16695/m.29475 type:complete len:221 (-) Transcript_16695:7-669(-)